MAAQYPSLNPFQAVSDLLGPVLKSLEIFDPQPWELLPGGSRARYQLAGLDEPYVEMLGILHAIWYDVTKKPLHFTYQDFEQHHSARYLQVHHAEPTRQGQYELVSVTDLECEFGYLIGLEYLLHWRLQKRDKVSRQFQRLNFLALSLLDYTLLGNFCEGFMLQEDAHTRAYMEFFEIYSQQYSAEDAKKKVRKRSKVKAFTHKELEALQAEAGEHNGNGALYCFLAEHHRYGKLGPEPYFKQLLTRYRKVFSRQAIKHNPVDSRHLERQEMMRLYDQLLPQAKTQQQKLVCELANHCEQLYVSWPVDHVYQQPSLHAYSQDSEWSKPGQGLFGPDASREGECLLQYYQLPFSLEDLTGTAHNQEADMYLDSGMVEGPVWITRALADGSLPLLHNGQIDPGHPAVLPAQFPLRVGATMEKLLEIDRVHANNLKWEGAYDFSQWFSTAASNRYLKKLMGCWELDTLDRLSKKKHSDYSAPDICYASTEPSRLIDILGDDDFTLTDVQPTL